jgi:hypothetical protein
VSLLFVGSARPFTVHGSGMEYVHVRSFGVESDSRQVYNMNHVPGLGHSRATPQTRQAMRQWWGFLQASPWLELNPTRITFICLISSILRRSPLASFRFLVSARWLSLFFSKVFNICFWRASASKRKKSTWDEKRPRTASPPGYYSSGRAVIVVEG